MNRRNMILIALVALLALAPLNSVDAFNGHGGRGCGGGGLGIGFGIGGYNDICGYAELYRQLYNNLPYFALHPPVYYSYPVPRTYGYSPFAYPPNVMTPELVGAVEPLQIINPHVETTDTTDAKPATKVKSDRSAATNARIEPLVVINPFVATNHTVAQASR